MQPLPIDGIIPQVLATLKASSRLVLEAEAGAGKTTRVPAALLDSGMFTGEIWVAEPRRLAARLVAHRVAKERSEPIGQRIGYSVRFDERASKATRLRFVTSGILLRKLVTSPSLDGIDCVVLDEFHERHLDTDLALALLLTLQARRPALRIIIMSATLDGARIARHLGDCPRLFCEGRAFPLSIEFETNADDRPLEKRVTSAVRTLMRQPEPGSILVFLAGASEIRRCHLALEPHCESAGYVLACLHGDLPLEEQARAIERGTRPKVVLSTNVAESSITVDGVTAVVDSGTARRLETPEWSGIASLREVRVSRASAQQRAGRAGRIAEGRVFRLYSKGDWESRTEHDTPEILRLDFCEALMILYGCGLTDLDGLPLLDQPPPQKAQAAERLLLALGAINSAKKITDLGKRILQLGIHPRLARLAIACSDLGFTETGAIAAALLSEKDLRIETRTATRRTSERASDVTTGDSDLLELVELFEWAEQQGLEPYRTRGIGVDHRAAVSVKQAKDRLVRQLNGTVRDEKHASTAPDTFSRTRESALSSAVLCAFPDRVAKRRAARQPDFVLQNGVGARLSETSVVKEAPFVVAVDVDERRTQGRAPETMIRLASAVHPDLLLDVAAESLESEDELVYCDPPGRAEIRSRIRLGSLTIEESRRAALPGPETAALLVRIAQERGLFRAPEVLSLKSRLALLTDAISLDQIAPNTDALLLDAARNLLQLESSLDNIDGARLANAISDLLPSPLPERLRLDTPEYISLPGGRRCTVHYEPDQRPWIESRLQDFFGMTATPSVLRGKTPVTVRLLAPNQRPVQITNDLAGFWRNHYPELRRQLMRRYPKHAWPEDGQTAEPPAPRPGHRKP